MNNLGRRLATATRIIAILLILVNSLLLALPVGAASNDPFSVFSAYMPGTSVSGVDGYGDLLYYDGGDGIAYVVQVTVSETGIRDFTELSSYPFRSNMAWNGSSQGSFYVDAQTIYYGTGDGVAAWTKAEDGTFGTYLGRLNIPDREKNETLAYDAVSHVWYTATSSRAIYSFREGIDTDWQYEFTYTSYGKGQGNHGGMEFVGGYLFVSETKTDVIGQWEKTDAAANNGWVEAGAYTYTYRDDVAGLGFGPLGHFWAGGGADGTNKSPSLYEIGDATAGNIADFSWTPEPSREGSAVTFTDDSYSWPDRIIGLAWTFSDGTSSNLDSPVHIFQDNGEYPVTLDVLTENGYDATVTKTVTVENVAPTADAGQDRTVTEGSLVKFSGSFTDPGTLDTHTYSWDFGDATAPANVLNPTHVYVDNGDFSATLTVTDNDGGIGTDTVIINVNNAPPVVDAGPDQAAEVNGPVDLHVTVSDPGSADTHSYTITWGDGTTASGDVLKVDGQSYINPTHSYTREGQYAIWITVVDKDGASARDHVSVAVPVGVMVSVTPDTVPTPSNNQNYDLNDIPLHDIPLQDIPLQEIPLQDIGLQNTPLQEITLADIPLQEISWESLLQGTPLQEIPLQEIPLQEIFLSGIPLQEIPLQEIMMAILLAAPLQEITIDGTPLQEILLSGTPLQEIPLQEIPLQEISITGTPLQEIPLQEIPLQEIPLQEILLGTPLQEIPLQEITLGDLIAAGIPLRYADLHSSPLQEIPLQEISIYGIPLQEIVLTTPLQEIPLQEISLWDLALTSVRLQDISVNGIPLQDIPLQEIPLQEIPLQEILLDTPLQEIPLQEITLGDVALAAAPLQEITLNGTPLQEIPLQGTSIHAALSAIPLQEIPLQEIKINGVPLQEIPLQEIPLQEISWESVIEGTSLEGTPLQEITLNMLLDTIDISGTPLQEITLLDIVLGQAPLQEITLKDLILALIPLQEIPWESIPLQDIPLDTAFSGQNTVTYTVNVANYGATSADDLVVTFTLPEGFSYIPYSTTGATKSNPVINGNQLVWNLPSVAASAVGEFSFSASAPVALGTYYSSVSVTSSVDIPPSIDAAPVTITDTFENNDTWDTAADIGPDSLYVSYLSSESDVDWFRIPVPAERNSAVTVYLSHLPADYDLTLFAGRENLPTDIPLQDIPLQEIPLQDIPLQDIPLQEIPLQDIPLQDIPLQDIPLQEIPLQQIPLQDISFERGTTGEMVFDRVTNESSNDYYYVMVTGYNGASSNEPYTLRVKVTPPPPIESVIRNLNLAGPSGTVYEPYGDATETIIMTNVQRLGQYYPGEDAGLVTALQDFADLDNVRGLLFPVDSVAAVQDAYLAWDGNAGDPAAANAVAAAIRYALQDVLASHPNVKYLVIVGDDEILPFERVPDEVYLSNESSYASQAHLNSSALQASLLHGYILTDDYYTDTAPVPWMGRELYIPDYASGRLVEKPSEIIGLLNEFEARSGVLDVSTSLVTGYDFLTDGAQSIAAILEAQGIAVDDSLISQDWDALNLLSLLGGGYDIIALNSHFNHWALGPAVGEPFYDSQLAGIIWQDGTLVFSMGCHSGLNVDDSLVAANKPEAALDWPQAFAQKATWYIGNTGFGYGDSESVALTEELMANFAQNIATGQPVAIGQALAAAKQRYFLTMGSYGPFDEKILIESTLYGLPMYRINMVPVNPGTPAAGTSTIVTVNRLSGDTSLGTLTNTVDLAPTVTGDGTYYTADGRSQFIPYRPVEPVTDFDISYPGLTAHGSLFTGGIYQDMPIDPVIARPTEDQTLSQYEPQIINDGWYPAKLQTINSLENANGVSQSFIATLGQFVTTSAITTVTGTQRLYTEQNYDVYFSNSEDFSAPIIDLADVNIQGTTSPYTVSITVRARDLDDPALSDDGNIERVIVTWTYAANGSEWQSFDLTYNAATGAWEGSLSDFDGTSTDFIVQAVDNAGNIGLAGAKGFFYTPLPTEAGLDTTVPEGTAVAFTGSGSAPESDVTWYFGDGTSASGSYNQTHTYTDNGLMKTVLRGTDGKGGSGWDSRNIIVTNVAPTVTVNPIAPIAFTKPVFLSGGFTDPGTADTHTYKWEIIDETSGDTLVTAWGNLQLAINWLDWMGEYPAPGQYRAVLTVEDDDGGIGTDSTVFTIEPKETVLSAPVGEITYLHSTTIVVTLTDIDGWALLHQADAPKEASLEYSDGTTWVTLDTATLNDTDLTFTFAIPGVADLPAGVYNLRVVFGGDLYYRASFNDAGSLTVSADTVTISVATSAEVLPFETVTLSASVSDSSGTPLIDGPYTFSFAVDGQPIGTAGIGTDGQVSTDWTADQWPTATTALLTVMVIVDPNGYIQGGPGYGSVTLLSPQALKYRTIDALNGIDIRKPKSASQRDAAVAAIQDSLAAELWKDASHIDDKFGKAVFQAERSAVQDLLTLLDSDAANASVYTTAIEDLVKADQLLARILIAEAQGIIVDDVALQEEIQSQITTATAQYADAEALLATDPTGAITNFMQTWDSAIQVFALVK